MEPLGGTIPIKRNHQFNLGFFFSNSDFPSGIFSDFFRTALFSANLLLHTSLTTWTQQLFFPSIYFFKAAPFLRSSVFKRVISSQQLFFLEYITFRNETSTVQPLCENRKFFRAVTFRSSFFFSGLIFQNKDIYRRAPLIEAGTSAQHELFQKSYIFQEPTFSGELSFQSGHFFKSRYLLQQQPFQKSYFLTIYFFRRVTISQPRFLSTATLTIYQLVIQ